MTQRPSSLLSRRTFLHALGLGAALLPSLGPRRVVAGPAPVPKRILFFYGPGSLRRGAFNAARPRPVAGAPEATEKAWELPALHAALAPYKSRMIYLQGLSMVSAEKDAGPSPNNAHAKGARQALAPYNSPTGGSPGGISIDQFIARSINEPLVQTRVQWMGLKIGNWHPENAVNSSATTSGALEKLIWDPRDAYARYFGEPGDQSAAKRLERRLKAIALTESEFTSLRSRLGHDDRAKVEEHLDALSDLHAQLSLPAPACQPLDGLLSSTLTEKCDFGCYNKDAAYTRNYTFGRQLHAKMIGTAFGCDLTRVALLDVEYPSDELVGLTPELRTKYKADLHGLVHDVNDGGKQMDDGDERIKIVRRMVELEAETLATTLGELESRSAPDGKTLLDHTLVVWVSQIGYGNHGLNDLPWVIIGDGGGAFKTGRYVKLGKTAKGGDLGTPHGNLFTSLANAMDIPVATFGNPDWCDGPIGELAG